MWVGVGRFERRSSSASASLALCGRFNQIRSPYSWITMRRALRKQRVFDFVPSYLKCENLDCAWNLPIGLNLFLVVQGSSSGLSFWSCFSWKPTRVLLRWVSFDCGPNSFTRDLVSSFHWPVSEVFWMGIVSRIEFSAIFFFLNTRKSILFFAVVRLYFAFPNFVQAFQVRLCMFRLFPCVFPLLQLKIAWEWLRWRKLVRTRLNTTVPQFFSSMISVPSLSELPVVVFFF